jgi:formylglycine-generating enzyme required for sulfatase activity
MKKVLIFLFVFFQLIGRAHANNLVMGTPTKSGSTISFTIQWDNSWNVIAAPSNWDAIWVFVKRQHCDANAQTPWLHETLNSTSTNHTVTGTVLQVDLASSDNLGVFIRRKNQGVGNISQETVTLTLSSDVGFDNIAVYGIEMVYVPEGEFYIGDWNGNDFRFTDGNTYNPKLITQAIQSNGIGSANNYQISSYGCPGSLPAAFPLGYNGFYCMKKEITCKLYCDFLNSLTYTQQIYLWDVPNNAPSVANPGDKIMTRYGYNIEVISQTALQPAVYGCDANDDNNWNQADDGLELPIALYNKPFEAFLDWAAIRPMTEFEYEKACRGPITPVYSEYAWGTTDISSNYTIINRGTNYESSTTTPLGLSNLDRYTLYRAGIEATSSSDRIHAGASYYGILNLTGSVYETCIGGFQKGNYSNFTNINGNGNINNRAVATVTGWPNSTNGYIYRGASTRHNIAAQVSSRATYNYGDDYYYVQGGRGVRSY